MVESETKFEAIVKEFGNGAHITVPKEWVDDIVTVERICSFCPPVFENVEEGAEVILDISNGEEVSGEVIEFEVEIENEKNRMWSELILDTGHNFYRVQANRSAGDDGWGDEFEVERGLSSDEIHNTDEVITLNETGMWKPIGVVKSIAVKQPVSVGY